MCAEDFGGSPHIQQLPILFTRGPHLLLCQGNLEADEA